MKKVGELHPLEISKGLWQKISIDIIGLLPKSNEKDAIIVIVDQFTKMIRLKVITMAASSENRVPQNVLSDRGSQFASQFIEDLGKVLETKKTLSIVCHPQTDSQMERIN